jgi:Zn-dependent M16 (insulinase) family peptidase
MKQAWHYEFTEINNPKSELMYKGKLYDEMKEFFQNPNNIFKETVKN